jgi:hypothetical protein
MDSLRSNITVKRSGSFSIAGDGASPAVYVDRFGSRFEADQKHVLISAGSLLANVPAVESEGYHGYGALLYLTMLQYTPTLNDPLSICHTFFLQSLQLLASPELHHQLASVHV